MPAAKNKQEEERQRLAQAQNTSGSSGGGGGSSSGNIARNSNINQMLESIQALKQESSSLEKKDLKVSPKIVPKKKLITKKQVKKIVNKKPIKKIVKKIKNTPLAQKKNLNQAASVRNIKLP